MIQCKMLLLNQWLQKKWPISNLCSGQIKKKSLLILYLSSASLIKVFPPAGRPTVRRAIHSSLALVNRYNNNCSSYSVHICIWRISRWNLNVGDLNLFLQIIQVCLIPNRYIKHRSKKRLCYSVPVCTTCVSGEYRGQVEIGHGRQTSLDVTLCIVDTGTKNELLFQLCIRLCLHVLSSLGSSETFNSSQCFSTNFPLYNIFWSMNLDICWAGGLG